ncbi:conserved hypothetical protein [Lacticaseibacillus paracasei]|nr:conserved hypothetical protein [Lacticaseibacillus paracasei]
MLSLPPLFYFSRRSSWWIEKSFKKLAEFLLIKLKLQQKYRLFLGYDQTIFEKAEVGFTCANVITLGLTVVIVKMNREQPNNAKHTI